MPTSASPLRRRAVVAAAAALAVPLATGAVASAATVPLAPIGGVTVVGLTPSAAKALKASGVSLTAIKPAAKKSRGIALAVTSGTIDPATGRGTIVHTGGLRFRHGGRSVSLTGLRVRLASRGSAVSAKVGGARRTVFTLQTSRARVAHPGFDTVVTRLGVTLTPGGASALNAALGTSLAPGLIGLAETDVLPRTITLKTGFTTLAVDPTTSAALSGAGLSTTLIGPATAGPGGVSFPISPSRIASADLRGTIAHRGGLTFSTADAALTLTDPRVVIDSPTQGELDVQVGGATVALGDFTLKGARIRQVGRRVTITGIPATLSAAAAAALNTTFGTTVAAGTPLGTVTVDAAG